MFVKQDNSYSYSNSNIETLKLLPPHNFLLKFDARKSEFYLEKKEDFTLPDKIYNDPKPLCDRYLNTFKHKKGNLGILLNGLKGTGKSLLAKQLCIQSDLPVIIISEAFIGEEFKDFISSISQEIIIFIDEFEKIFSRREEQESLLSLLDGTFTGKKIFLFTSNSNKDLSAYLINRPGRIHYLKEYGSLELDIINEVIEDLLENKSFKNELLEVLQILNIINMDSLVTLIKEINMYNETPKVALKYLNLAPEVDRFEVDVYQNGEKIKDSEFYYDHPLVQGNVYIYFQDKENKYHEIEFDIENDMVSFKDGQIIIKSEDYELRFKPFASYKFAF